MTTQRSSARAHSEEELLEQWEFLDRLVERQANLLRAGVQDSEEVDDPPGAPADIEPLQQELRGLRAEVAALAEAREMAERRAAELEQRLNTAALELKKARQGHADALVALRNTQLEVERLRERLDTRRRGIWPFSRH